jgi:hypothetical protein
MPGIAYEKKFLTLLVTGSNGGVNVGKYRWVREGATVIFGVGVKVGGGVTDIKGVRVLGNEDASVDTSAVDSLAKEDVTGIEYLEIEQATKKEKLSTIIKLVLFFMRLLSIGMDDV